MKKNSTDSEQGHKMRLLFVAGNSAFQPVVTRFLERYDELTLVGSSVLESQKVVSEALYLRPEVILLDHGNIRPTRPGDHLPPAGLTARNGHHRPVSA